MAASLHHRGPDDSGVFLDPSAGLGLAHTRLSIIDRSRLGAQPMTSSCGRFTLVFNGEIYNYRSLREELRSVGIQFRSETDTEVLLEMVIHRGVEHSLQAINGMFAFALWDHCNRKLFLARDRFGEKPLYFGWTSAGFCFASELKALHQIPEICLRLNHSALPSYFALGYIPAPASIYEDIYKLPPGTYLSLTSALQQQSPISYWSLAETSRIAAQKPKFTSIGDARSALEDTLREAVGMRLVSDVPLGAFLSGGVDSTLLVSFMQELSNQPVKTFTVGIEGSSLDESAFGRAAAAHLGTAHTELHLSASEAMQTIPLLPTLYDEPFADSSQIPTLLVSRLARKDVTVAISGDGGDELFGGYSRYRMGPRIWSAISWISHSIREKLALPFRDRRMHSNRFHKFVEFLSLKSEADLHQRLLCAWPEPSAILLSPPQEASDKPLFFPCPEFESISRKMMFRDASVYLPDDILTKVDRASMSVGLEVRAPFLDPEVAEFSMRLPMNWMIRGNVGKSILRQILSERVPSYIFNRPKQGFGIPIGDWLRGPMRDWAECLLTKSPTHDEGILNYPEIQRLWESHLQGALDANIPIWTVLMFQSWLRKWK